MLLVVGLELGEELSSSAKAVLLLGGIIGGPVGAAIGGFAGSVVGGIAGAFGGSWLGEKAAGEVLNSNKK